MGGAYFEKKRVWITGASAGIGRAVACELSARGASVIVSARNREALTQLVTDCLPRPVYTLPMDVADRQANLQTVKMIEERFSGLDIAIFNAGTCEYVNVATFDSALFERMIQTNFLSMVYGIEAVLPLLRRSSHPHLVGMSSTVAYAGLSRAEAYAASKAAIKNMLEGLRIDLRKERIPVSIICPGFVKTPLTERNDFPMPFAISAEEAANRIADGIAAQKQEIHFPKRFSLTFKLLSSLPSPLYTWLGSRLVRPS